MPIKQRDGKWYWGKQGPFNSREKAVEVAQAAYSSGYKAKDMEKSWITNPRGDRKNDKGSKKYIEADTNRFDTASEYIQKEGDGGGGDGGSFGGGAGTVFTSETAGIFTPTHSERSKRKKNNKKPPTGIDRLNDFITERSPERKMQKGFAWDLVDWVRKELKKADELQSDRVDDNTWKTEKNPIEFDAEPDKHAAEEQLAERQLTQQEQQSQREVEFRREQLEAENQRAQLQAQTAMMQTILQNPAAFGALQAMQGGIPTMGQLGQLDPQALQTLTNMLGFAGGITPQQFGRASAGVTPGGMQAGPARVFAGGMPTARRV